MTAAWQLTPEQRVAGIKDRHRRYRLASREITGPSRIGGQLEDMLRADRVKEEAEVAAVYAEDGFCPVKRVGPHSVAA